MGEPFGVASTQEEMLGTMSGGGESEGFADPAGGPSDENVQLVFHTGIIAQSKACGIIGGMTDKTKGTLCIIASALGFAVMGLCVGLAGTEISSFQKSFFRNLVAVVVAALLFVRAGGPRKPLPKGGLRLLVLRSIFGTIGIFSNFYALSHIPLGDAQTLNKLAPFVAVVASWLFLRERISWRQGFCILGAFLGALFVVKPGFASTSLVPALVGFAGGVAAGSAYTCVRELGVMKVDSKFIVLFFSVFSSVATLPFIVFDFQPMTCAQVLVLIGAGLGAAIGQFGITAAYRFAPPREIAAWDYTNILFSALLGFLFLGQVPDVWSWVGFVIIIAMAVLLHGRPQVCAKQV